MGGGRGSSCHPSGLLIDQLQPATHSFLGSSLQEHSGIIVIPSACHQQALVMPQGGNRQSIELAVFGAAGQAHSTLTPKAQPSPS